MYVDLCGTTTTPSQTVYENSEMNTGTYKATTTHFFKTGLSRHSARAANRFCDVRPTPDNGWNFDVSRRQDCREQIWWTCSVDENWWFWAMWGGQGIKILHPVFVSKCFDFRLLTLARLTSRGGKYFYEKSGATCGCRLIDSLTISSVFVGSDCLF